MTAARQRPLSGLVVNLSISESEDSDRLGFPGWLVNRISLQFASALLGQGASVAFGHDWRDDGVMQAVYSYARQLRSSAVSGQTPLLWNLLAWPDQHSIPVEEVQLPRPILTVEVVGLPPDLSHIDAEARAADSKSDVFRYCRARALTHLRHRLTALSDARVCIGGRTIGTAGRYPGLVEEAVLAIQASTPLFLVGLLGGATKRMLDAARFEAAPPPVLDDPAMRGLYETPPVAGTGGDQADLVYGPSELNSELKAFWHRMAGQNGLTERQNTELADTQTVDRAIELVLAGLANLKATR